MKKIINTPNSPQPIGPYNQAILKNNTLFISGQIALDPKTMKLINDSIKEETIQVMENLKNIYYYKVLVVHNSLEIQLYCPKFF